MPLPDTIPVKYTEEEAEYLSMRPVVRQTFRAAELVDMILGVAGKDPDRIRQILRSGTVVFHSYRYWWQGFEAEPAALAEILSRYPDSDPSRVFRAEDCTEVILESSGAPARYSLRLRREDAGRRRLFRARSFWGALMALARDSTPRYREYSYALRGDTYDLQLGTEKVAQLAKESERLAPRPLLAQLSILSSISQVAFVCPRPGR